MSPLLGRALCVAFTLMLAAGLSACRSSAPRTVQPPTLAVLPTAGHTPMLVFQSTVTPWPPTTEPDAQGYFPAPPTDPTDEAFLYSIEQETPDGGPAGAIVSKLQALLDQGDAEGLAAIVGSNPNDRLDFCGPFNYIPTSCPGSIRSAEAQRTLQRLFDAGSRPIVQGYFAPFNSSELGAPPDTFYVVSTGWRGAFDFGDVEVPTPSPDHPLDPMPTAATDTVVWRVVIGDKGPRWDNWMWCDHGLYEATVFHLAWETEGGDSIPIPYHVVRPTDP